MEAFVFDTYALLEIINGNKNYEKYLDAEPVINDFVLAELCYKLIRESNYERAEAYVDKYALFCKELEPEIIKQAMLFRAKNIKKAFSITDAIGYTMALRLGIKFLTGDKQFKDMKGVEFVK